MDLSLHLLIHLFFSLLAGYVVFRLWGKPLLSFVFAIIGGFLVDFDHLLDYYLAFGWNFNFYWFSKGYEFLKSDKIYLLFHGWEYVIILLSLGLFLKNIKIKTLILALAFGLFLHLSGDVIMNEGLTVKSYSVVYRIKNDFQIEKLVTPEHYQYNVEKRQNPEIREIIHPVK